jgi:hypothetical protein
MVSTRSRTLQQHEIEAGALILLLAADPHWDTPDSSSECEEEEGPAAVPDVEENPTASDAEDDAAASAEGDPSATTTPAAGQPVVPAPAHTVAAVAISSLTALQTTQQQQRQAMTPRQRTTAGLRAYDNLDASGAVVGTLWQTPAERRTFRQTQRRRGAKIVRTPTTKGRKFPDRKRGGGRGGGGAGSMKA